MYYYYIARYIVAKYYNSATNLNQELQSNISSGEFNFSKVIGGIPDGGKFRTIGLHCLRISELYCLHYQIQGVQTRKHIQIVCENVLSYFIMLEYYGRLSDVHYAKLH